MALNHIRNCKGSLLFAVLDGIPLLKIPSLKNLPPPLDFFVPPLHFLSLGTSVGPPSSLLRHGYSIPAIKLSLEMAVFDARTSAEGGHFDSE
jgi:hypothetical protein